MSLVYFTDRDLGNAFPDILAAAGLKVERHRDHFAPDCADEEWLRAIGERRWVAVTRDGRIRYKPNELQAVIHHSVTLLVIVGKVAFPELARNFVATSGKIATFIAHHSPPLIAKVYRAAPSELARNPDVAGSVARWYPR